MPDAETNLPYFSHPETVLEYARAAVRLGLWESEHVVLERFVAKDARVLELGCGAARVAVAMARAGWTDILATDFSSAMVDAALGVVAQTGVTASVRCEVADATALPYPENTFDTVVFAFNGLLMIPGPGRREAAIREIARVLKPGGVLFFSGHDRTATRAAHWAEETRRWESGQRSPDADRLGDSVYETPQGRVFIHSAAEAELRDELSCAGLEIIFSEMRSAVADEPREVREFSDDTRLRVAAKRR